jgi:OOP family OmpA-OmpF porin
MKKFLFVAIIGLSFSGYAEVYKDAVIDKDNDGIYDERGNCVRTTWNSDDPTYCGTKPKTMASEPSRIREEARYRPVETKTRVYFDFDKANLRPDAKRELNSLVDTVGSRLGQAEVTISGHADRIGASSYNQKLSERRAQAVEDYLASKGLRKFKTDVTAKGESESVTDCRDKQKEALIRCLQRDRRVEIILE